MSVKCPKCGGEMIQGEHRHKYYQCEKCHEYFGIQTLAELLTAERERAERLEWYIKSNCKSINYEINCNNCGITNCPLNEGGK